MAKLEDLSDGLLLNILHRLPIESFYCLARTCRRFRCLSHDRTLSFQLQPLATPFEPEDCPGALILSPTLPGLCEAEVDLFHEPREYGPPWSDDLTGLDERLSWMQPNDLRNNIYTPDGDAMFDVAGLLLRDTLCSFCWGLRQTDKFRDQLQRLMRPVHCAGCQKLHTRIHFPELRQGGSSLSVSHRRDCIGRTARFRVCSHKRLAWDEYNEACCSPSSFDCDQCDTTFDASTKTIRTYVTLVRGGDSGSNFGSNGALASIRTRLEQASVEQQPCPHFGINDRVFVDYLFQTIRIKGLINVEQDGSGLVEKPLLDYGGEPWGCRICKASFHLRYQRSPSDATEPCTNLDLVIARSIIQINSPSDSRWLAQRENTGDYYTSAAHGITWCAKRTCGTSKRRRKEALIIRMLKAAIGKPEADADGDYFEQSAELLKLTFLWFWSAENRRVVRRSYRQGEFLACSGDGALLSRATLHGCAREHAGLLGEYPVKHNFNYESLEVMRRYRAYLRDARYRVGDLPSHAERQFPFDILRRGMEEKLGRPSRV
ncbi:hypothetical protein PG988_003616 [Apiospora saccharicola]